MTSVLRVEASFKGVEKLHGTKVGVEVQPLAQAQYAGFGPFLVLDLVPLGTAHGGLQDRLGGLAGLEGVVRKRVVELVDGDAPRVLGFVFELVTEHHPDAVEDLFGLLANFRPDPIPSENDDVVIHPKLQK